MITITNLSKSYGKKILFEKVSLNINRQEKIGFVGPNGAGKTTFFSIILGKTEPSNGSIQINKRIRIGYLPQEQSFHSERTVLGELLEGDEYISRLKQEKEHLEISNKAGTPRYGEILYKLENLGYFELEHKAKKILSGLGFKEKDFNRPIKELSGGWQMRVLLAKLLSWDYDLLLLDEPTNYLDLAAALWFKDYLTDFKGTFIIISHDKVYLTEVTNWTLILENNSIIKIKGNFNNYEKLREEKKAYLLRQFKEQEKKKKQLETFISRFHAQPNKAAQVRVKKRFLERMETIAVPDEPHESINKFHFPPTQESGWRVMKLEKISKSYGDICVYKDFDFEITKGEKAVLMGENGAGKSTLLKILAGVLEIDRGQRFAGHNVTIGYFSQTRLDVLNQHNTVLEEAYSAGGGKLSQEAVRTILGTFLFTGDDATKLVKVLSGGEKSRLILAKLLINPPNFLLLDEPTTHLDVDAVEALIQALLKYEGTIVFISHEIYFVKSLANTVFEVKYGNVKKFPGDFGYYMDKKANDNEKKILKSSNLDKHLILKVNKTTKIEEIPYIEYERKQKSHNSKLKEEIKKLRKEREKLEVERYAKERLLPNWRHKEETMKEYVHRLKEIDKRIKEIDDETDRLKSQFL